MTRITVVSAGLGRPSSTRLLADRLTAATRRALADRAEVEVTVVELRELAHDVTNALLTGVMSPALRAAVDAVAAADGLIAVTPIFTASYSGLFKSFVDVLDPQSLHDMPVLLAATGGTQRHSLAIEFALRPLFGYLRARPVATAVFAAAQDWGAAGDELGGRIDRAAGELAAEVRRSTRQVRDPWALTGSFEDLLRPAG